MSKAASAIYAVASLLMLEAACASVSSGGGPVVSAQVEGERAAMRFPEVQIMTRQDEVHTGKLTAIGEGYVLLRPQPYWNVEAVKVSIEAIRSVKRLNVSSGAGKGFLSGVGSTFLAAGIAGLLISKYDRDYKNWLSGSAILSLGGGLIGLFAGGINDLATRTDYDFDLMDEADKWKTLRKIMGL